MRIDPDALTDNGWKLYAECSPLYNAGTIPNMFPNDNDRDAIRTAKAVCGACPVRDACLAAAEARGERWGIWGGLTPMERTTLRRRKSRNRTNTVTSPSGKRVELPATISTTGPGWVKGTRVVTVELATTLL